jgi:hypothetical protein
MPPSVGMTITAPSVHSVQLCVRLFPTVEPLASCNGKHAEATAANNAIEPRSGIYISPEIRPFGSELQAKGWMR